jgi:plastocyanin
LFVILLVVLLLAAGAAYYFFLKPAKEEAPAPTTPAAEQAPTINDTVVEITATGLNPSTVKIPAGSQVTWKNTDAKERRISADPYPSRSSLPELDSQDPLAQGDSFSFIFEDKGTYTYHDYLNPTDKAFQGTVIVE